jgi:hypothetical protein
MNWILHASNPELLRAIQRRSNARIPLPAL